MQQNIADIQAKAPECTNCAIAKGTIKPKEGSIFTSKHFEAHQDQEIPLHGFIILQSKRHIKAVDELSPDERKEFADILPKLRNAMRNLIGVSTAYIFQEEDSPHFNAAIFPIEEWMIQKYGKKIQNVRLVMEYARNKLKTPENEKKIEESIQKLKAYFKW